MKPPRFHIAWLMIVVAVVALDLGAIRARDSEYGEELLYLALPTVNILALVGIVGFRRRRARPFAVGFVPVAALSTVAFIMWSHENPWTALRYLGYLEPPLRAIDRGVTAVWPGASEIILGVIVVVIFAIPHTVLGLAGGCLTATGWRMIARRKRAWRGMP